METKIGLRNQEFEISRVKSNFWLELSRILRNQGFEKLGYIQLFRERLSEKAHATIPKGMVGSFKFTVP